MCQDTAVCLLAQQVWQANVWDNKSIFRHLIQVRQSGTTEETLTGKSFVFYLFLKGKENN